MSKNIAPRNHLTITLVKRNENNISVEVHSPSGLWESTYLPTNNYSAMLVVEALLNDVEPPRNYRNVTAPETQSTPLEGCRYCRDSKPSLYKKWVKHLKWMQMKFCSRRSG